MKYAFENKSYDEKGFLNMGASIFHLHLTWAELGHVRRLRRAKITAAPTHATHICGPPTMEQVKIGRKNKPLPELGLHIPRNGDGGEVEVWQAGTSDAVQLPHRPKRAPLESRSA